MWQTEWSTAATKPIVISAWLDADRSINSSIIVIRETERERARERHLQTCSPANAWPANSSGKLV